MQFIGWIQIYNTSIPKKNWLNFPEQWLNFAGISNFDDFFEPLTDKVRDKIDEVLFMMTILERVPTKFFKSIEGIKGLFEIRVEYESNIYRIFCCFDKGNLVVLFNVFQKKTQKTPTKELNKAEKIMVEYCNEQKNTSNVSKK